MRIAKNPQLPSVKPLEPDNSVKHPTARVAYVLYGTARNECTGVTRHDIKNGALGKAILMDANELCTEIASIDSAANSFGLRAENVLLETNNKIMWYTKRQRRLMWFRLAGGVESLIVEWTPLLWCSNKNGSNAYVLALPNNSRPTYKTKLYIPPLMNISASGSLCQGTARFPTELSASNLDDAESCLFDSQFTHVNCSETIKGIGRDNLLHVKFWRDIQRNNSRVFPRHLTPAPTKIVADFIKERFK